MKRPTKKQVLGAIGTAAMLIPAVRVGGAVFKVGAGAARTTAGRAVIKKAAPKVRGAMKKVESHMEKKFRLQDAYDAAQRAARRKK